jgi:diguanylate cyclase (GGDEF)-like protein/PAS domain S-box-containing protein
MLAALGSAGGAWVAAGSSGLAGALTALRYRRLLQHAASESSELSTLLQNLPEGIYRATMSGRILMANRALARLNGYDSEAEMLKAIRDATMDWYVEGSRRDLFLRLLHRDGVVENFVSEVYRHRTRERIWISESARLVRDRKTEEPLFYEGSVREVTETMQRLRLEERFQKIIRAVPGVLFQARLSRAGYYRVDYLSPAFERMTGIDPATLDANGDPFVARIHPEDIAGYRQSLSDALEKLTFWDHEFRYRHPSGEEKWLRISANAERGADGAMLFGYIADISWRKRQEIEIEKLAFYDSLTGLPNRRLLIRRIEEAMAACRARRGHAALLFIDLDNFKPLNDTQGHDIGDEYLVQVARRLCQAVGPDDTVARIGGDEFVIVLTELGFDPETGSCRAAELARRILAELSSEFHLGIVQHRSSASIGFAAFDGSEPHVEDLLKRADMAMYEAKTAGRSRIAIFDPETLRQEAERYRLINDLRFAISEHRFVLDFEPRLDVQGRIIGAEARPRWPHEEFGNIRPAEFVPLAEQIGLEIELGKVVLTMALASLARWKAEPRLADMLLAVNLGVPPYASEEIADLIERQAERAQMDLSRLTLDIDRMPDEKEEAKAATRIGRLRSLGVRLALSGFGSANMAISSIAHLAVDEIKLGEALVQEIDTGPTGRILAGHLLSLARALKVAGSAQGITTHTQHDFLKEAGCRFYQGPLFGPALAADLLEELVKYSRPLQLTSGKSSRKAALSG